MVRAFVRHGTRWCAAALAVALCARPALAVGVGLLDGLQVMRQAEERYKGDDRREQLTISVYRGTSPQTKPRVMSVRWFEKDLGKENKIVVRFTEPREVAGTSLLMHVLPYKDDDRWLYFPKEKIQRRIRARDKNSNFMGTDFTYDDLADREPDEENHTLVKVEPCGATTCYVVESTPKDKTDAGYSKTQTWVEKDHFVKVRIEYWDLGGRHLKTYTAEKIVEVQGAWIPTLLVMDSDLYRQRTVVERAAIKLNVGLKDELFASQRLADFPFEKY